MAEISEDVQSIVSQSIETFTTDLHTMVADKIEGNFVCSSLSVHVVLAMAAYGAEGKTAQEMRTVLHLPDNEDQGYRGFQNFIDSMNNVQKVILKLANRVYANKDINIKDKFKEITSTYFRSESAPLDVSKPAESAKDVNQWCFDKTNSKIHEIIQSDDITPDTAIILLNAVYFKGNWKDTFNAKATQSAYFYVNKMTTVQVPTMYIKKKFFYKDLPEQNAECIALPYENEDLYMVIIVPKEIDGLKDIEKNLDKIKLHADEFENKREICLYLPKFKIETMIDLNADLKELGMVEMFSSTANFKGITDGPVKVDKVRQKAFIEVNEEGSEAAAVTGVTKHRRKRPLHEPLILMVNRPFSYRIFDAKRNIILFAGRVVEPNRA